MSVVREGEHMENTRGPRGRAEEGVKELGNAYRSHSPFYVQ